MANFTKLGYYSAFIEEDIINNKMIKTSNIYDFIFRKNDFILCIFDTEKLKDDSGESERLIIMKYLQKMFKTSNNEYATDINNIHVEDSMINTHILNMIGKVDTIDDNFVDVIKKYRETGHGILFLVVSREEADLIVENKNLIDENIYRCISNNKALSVICENYPEFIFRIDLIPTELGIRSNLNMYRCIDKNLK